MDESISLKEERRTRGKSTARYIARTALIAALYTALTYCCAPIAYGPIQFRISEALTILPLFYVEAIPALALGCFLSNLISTPWDMLLGTLATLVAAIATRAVRNVLVGAIFPVIANAFTVPAIFILTDVSAAYWFNVLTVGGGELAVVALLGIPLYFAWKNMLKKHPSLR